MASMKTNENKNEILRTSIIAQARRSTEQGVLTSRRRLLPRIGDKPLADNAAAASVWVTTLVPDACSLVAGALRAFRTVSPPRAFSGGGLSLHLIFFVRPGYVLDQVQIFEVYVF